MLARTTLEKVTAGLPLGESFPNGTMVEVTYDIPQHQRKITYIGTVAMRPEEKAEQSVVTRKFGGEHIIPMAATYTIKTASKHYSEYVDTGEGLELLQTTECQYPADLIFDPQHPGFSVQAVAERLPIPREAA